MIQPLLLNHEGKNPVEILGYTSKEEFTENMNKLDADNIEDRGVMLAATLLAAFDMMPKSQAGLLGILFQIIYGEDKIPKLSNVVETVVNTIPTEKQVARIMKIVADEGMGNEFR